MYGKKIFIKEIKIFLMIFCGCVTLGFLLIIGCYALPIEPIFTHVSKSAPIFQNEGTYPQLFTWCTSQQDNWTDALMLLNASHSEENDSHSLLDRALNVYRISAKDKNPAESLVIYFGNDKETQEISVGRGYGRYWHGYLVFLKPLLLILRYDQIRILNLLLQPFLTGILLYILYKKNLTKWIMPYIFTIILLMPLSIALSMQFATVFYLFTITSIIVLLKFNYLQLNHRDIYFFMIIGMATSYFDFLTYPIATLGIPLIFYVILQNNSDLTNTMHKIKKIVLLSIGWGIGYVGMWMSKWVIGTVLTSENMIKDAFGSVVYRSTYGVIEQEVSLTQILSKNIQTFFKTPFIIYIIIYVFVCLMIMIKKQTLNRGRIGTVIPFMLICLMPFIWWIVAGNHSWIHYWFTNKSMCVFIFAILCLFRQGCENTQTAEKNSKG